MLVCSLQWYECRSTCTCTNVFVLVYSDTSVLAVNTVATCHVATVLTSIVSSSRSAARKVNVLQHAGKQCTNIPSQTWHRTEFTLETKITNYFHEWNGHKPDWWVRYIYKMCYVARKTIIVSCYILHDDHCHESPIAILWARGIIVQYWGSRTSQLSSSVLAGHWLPVSQEAVNCFTAPQLLLTRLCMTIRGP